MSLQFSNGLIAPLIVSPLRYYFGIYTKDNTNIYWNEDEKERTVDIGEAYDFNKIPLQEKPRVIVTRGAYIIEKVGLTDNLVQAKPLSETRGNKDYKNMVFYRGSATILVEARNKGTCELLTDMVSHFIVWTRPMLCDSLGWKEFGLPLTVSDCQLMTGEDPNLTKFQTSIMIPWMKEEEWRYQNDGVTLKKILTSVTPQY